MNEFKLLPDDPRLTAYALGELEGDERAEVEAALRHDAAARAQVEEIRATVVRLESALMEEESQAEAQRLEVIEGGDEANGREEMAGLGRNATSEPWRRARLYYVAAGLAAACFAVLVALNPRAARPEPTHYVEVPLVASAEPTAAAPRNAGLAMPGAAPTAAVVSTEERAGVDVADVALPPLPTAVATDNTGTSERLAEVQERNERGGSVESQVENSLPPALASAGTPSPVDMPLPEVTNQQRADESGSALPKPAAPPLLALQYEAVPPEIRLPASDDDVVTLSPFEVAVDPDRQAARPLAETRSARARRAMLPTAPRGARFADDAEADARVRDNDFVAVADSPLSTMPAEIEMESYANARKLIEAGRLPARQDVRIEELLNYFPYRYAPPTGDAPFAAQLAVTEAPWAPEHRLVRIALKGREVADDYPTTAPHMRQAANLVFLIDVSASMSTHAKLPAVQDSIRRLLTRLRPDDRVALVTYSGNEGLALPSLPASRAQEIEAAVTKLRPESDTGGAKGLRLAYNVARASFVPDGINRVILCTDGDFHLGLASEDEMLRLVANRARFGIGLSVLAFGATETRPEMVQALAAHGQGRFAYVQDRGHAEKLLAVEIESPLTAIAEDVKIEVEFNPAKVARYRLIGYENPPLRRDDFNEAPAGGKIRAGHTLTALYEIVPVGLLDKPKEAWGDLEDLRYGHLRAVKNEPRANGSALSNELLTVKVRYKKPHGLVSRLLEFPVTDGGERFAEASGDFKFAAAVAGFGMILRKSPHRGKATMGDVIAWAAGAAADDPGDYRRDFLGLARQAQALLQ